MAKKWHGVTSIANLKRDVHLILVYLGTFSSGALNQHVRCMAALRLTSGKTVKNPCKDGEAQGALALPSSSCLNLSSPGAGHAREGASKMATALVAI